MKPSIEVETSGLPVIRPPIESPTISSLRQRSNSSEPVVGNDERIETVSGHRSPDCGSQRSPNHADDRVRRVCRIDAVVHVDDRAGQ